MPLIDYKNLRALTGLTQKAFGEKIGLKEKQVQRRETGKVQWTMAEIMKICAEFGLRIELDGRFVLAEQ